MARLLLVDDDEEIRGLYQQIVAEMGHEVVAARDAKEAKAVIQCHEDLDVAIIDRILPGEEDGLDILKFIQAHRPHCQTIIISGHPSFDSASEALRANASDYLAKPVQKERLCQAVRAALEEKKAIDEKALDVERSKKGFEELKSKQEMLQHDMRSLVIGIVGFLHQSLKFMQRKPVDFRHEFIGYFIGRRIEIE